MSTCRSKRRSCLSGSALFLEFPENPVATLDMKGLSLSHGREHLSCFPGLVPVTVELRNQGLLPCDRLRALGDVALGLNQVSLSKSTICERLFHGEALLWGGSATAFSSPIDASDRAVTPGRVRFRF